MPLVDPDRPLEAALEHALAVVRSDLGMDAALLSQPSGDDTPSEVVVAAEGDLSAFALVLGGRLDTSGSPSARVLAGEALVVPDLDVTGLRWPGGGARAYLGVPVTTAAGEVLGSLALLAARATTLEQRAVDVLTVIARLVSLRLDADGAALHHHRRVADEVTELLSTDALRVVFQPIVELEAGVPLGYEALARFPGSSRSPAEWFAEATAAGVGTVLEIASLRLALARAEELPAGTYLSLNVSAAALLDADVLAVLEDAPDGRLVVEITEHAPVADYGALGVVVERLRRRGQRLAIDDAGAGFANMQHVLALRPDLIKLDLAIVRAIDTDPLRKALAAALVTFAASAGLELVAEGVETWSEASTLWDLGVYAGQGHLFGRPEPDPRAPLGRGPAP